MDAATNAVLDESEAVQKSGVWRELGDLPAGAVVSRKGLAEIFGKHEASIDRAIQREELPPPIRFLGGPVWTAGAILAHINSRLEQAQEAAEEAERELSRLRA